MRRNLFALLGCITLAAAPAPPKYELGTSIAGPDGAWDYASVDGAEGLLFVARGASVTLVDLRNGGAVTDLGAVSRAHAAVPLPGHRLLVTSGNDATVRFFDLGTRRQIASVGVGKKPDAAIADPRHHRAFVMNAESGTVSVIDTAAMKVTSTITVKPGLEYGALDSRGTLFVNDEDANEVEIVDVARTRSMGSIALGGCEAPSGLAYDARHDRLIAACANGKAAIIDARARRLVKLLDIGRGPDAVILDPVRRLASIPCGRDGVLDILALDAPGGVERVGRVQTAPGARTGTVDPATGVIYLPTADFGPPSAQGARPPMLPGTFRVLVVRPS